MRGISLSLKKIKEIENALKLFSVSLLLNASNKFKINNLSEQIETSSYMNKITSLRHVKDNMINEIKIARYRLSCYLFND